MGNQGRTIYLVKVGNDVLVKTFSLDEAKETLNMYNVEDIDINPNGSRKAKLYKATVVKKAKA